MAFLSYFIEFIAVNRDEFIVYRDKSKTREISLSNTELLETFLVCNTLVVSIIYMDARQLVAAATDLMTV